MGFKENIEALLSRCPVSRRAPAEELVRQWSRVYGVPVTMARVPILQSIAEAA